MHTKLMSFIAFLVFQLLVTLSAQAATEAEKKAIWDSANTAALFGPTDVTLGNQATLHLLEGMMFVPRKESADLMKLWGNRVNNGFFGLIMSTAQEEYWVTTIDHLAEGYVKDDDAKSWNASELLQSLKDGTEAGNDLRKEQGIPALHVTDWIQTPTYDANFHKLVWSIRATTDGAAPDEAATVNFNTYALGRDGYFEINLLSNEREVEKDKVAAYKIIDSLEYLPGKQYADYIEGVDRVAEYGIAALVAGVAAKKLGMLALSGVFFAKFAKLILVGFAVAGGALLKLFNRGKDKTL